MALIVEDGSIVTGANTYVSRADAIAYAATRGVTVADDETTDAKIINAACFLESFSSQFVGELYERDQPMSWPRIGAVVEGWAWNSNEIPRQVVTAQLTVMLEIQAGDDPFNPTPVVGQVVEKTIGGAVSVKYAAGSAGAQKVSKARESMTIIRLMLRRAGLFSVRS